MMSRILFVDPEVDTLPLFDDGQYWIKVKHQLNAGEDKRLSAGALRRSSMNEQGNPEAGFGFDLDLEAAVFAKVCIYLVDWNLTDAAGKTVAIDTPKAALAALKALHPDVFREIERVVDAHAASRQEKKVPVGPRARKAS